MNHYYVKDQTLLPGRKEVVINKAVRNSLNFFNGWGGNKTLCIKVRDATGLNIYHDHAEWVPFDTKPFKAVVPLDCVDKKMNTMLRSKDDAAVKIATKLIYNKYIKNNKHINNDDVNKNNTAE